MTTAVIIQARITSRRLPGKVLLPLDGKTVLQRVVDTCQRISGTDVVAVAIPDNANNDCLVPHVQRSGAFLVRGSEDDVLGRYAKAANAIDADVIVRVTCDCPMLDASVAGQVVDLFRGRDVDYASNVYPARHFPTGWDVECFSREILERANREAKDAYSREHATPFMQRHGRVALLKDMVDRSSERCVLDTIDDYIALARLFDEAPADHRAA